MSSTTRAAVETFLAAAEPDPQHLEAFFVAAAAAMRLAEVLDIADTGSGAANASRELRAQFELMRLMLADPGPSVADLRERQSVISTRRIFDDIAAELNAAMLEAEAPPADESGDDPDPPTFAH